MNKEDFIWQVCEAINDTGTAIIIGKSGRSMESFVRVRMLTKSSAKYLNFPRQGKLTLCRLQNLKDGYWPCWYLDGYSHIECAYDVWTYQSMVLGGEDKMRV